MDSRKTASFTSSEQRLIDTEVRVMLNSLPYPILEEDDLQSYAYVGFLEAKKRFNPSYNVPFSTFARYRIRGAMLDGVRKSSQYGRTGYATLKSWIQYETNQPLSRNASVNPSTQSDSSMLDDSMGMTHFQTLQQMATHLWIENMISFPLDEADHQLEQADQKNRLSQAFSELDSTDQELMIALYDLKRCGDNAKTYAQRKGIHRSSVYRKHDRILAWLRNRVINLS